jgi:hypothetical protein
VSGVDFDIRGVLVLVRILQDVVLGVGDVSGVGHFSGGSGIMWAYWIHAESGIIVTLLVWGGRCGRRWV